MRNAAGCASSTGTGETVTALGWLVISAAVTPLIWLGCLPFTLPERRLRRHGRVIAAVCRQHLNPDHSDGPIRLRCTYRPDPQRGEYTAIVRTDEHIPQVGEEFEIVYDPKNPHRAENHDVTTKGWYGYGDVLISLIWLGGNLLLLSFAP